MDCGPNRKSVLKSACHPTLQLLYVNFLHCALVAQLDRALASEAKGCGFESRRAHHLFLRNHVPKGHILLTPGRRHYHTEVLRRGIILNRQILSTG